jgi:hypothetical protein
MRRRLVALAALLVLVIGAHALVWRWATGTIDAQYERWVSEQRGHGWIVTSGEPVRGGWPMDASLILPQPHIANATQATAARLAWDGERVVIGVALLHPRTLTIRAEGTQHLRLGDGPDIPITAERLVGTVPLTPGEPAREVDVSGRHLRAGVALASGAADEASGGLTISLLSLHVASNPGAGRGEAALSLAGSAQDIGLPPLPAGRSWPFGPRIASVSVEGTVDGPLPRGADPVAQAVAWRDGGGTVAISRFAIGWGPLGLNATATLSLDAAMQPQGSATLHLVGAPDAIDALAANGVIPPRTALAAKAVLGLMSREPEGGGAPQVDVPLTLQDRKLAMGRFPLATVPELVWPSGK